jgi:HK97 family phage prohead protease
MKLLEEILCRRSIEIRRNSWDPETRTFWGLISSGAAVRRRDHRGDYIEVLDFEGVSRLAFRDLPVLDNHRTDSVRAVVGVVQDAHFKADGLHARVRIGLGEDGEAIAQRIADGLLKGLSIGYRIRSSTWSTDSKSGTRVRTVKPDVFEVSLVIQPADPAAQIRSNPMTTETLDREGADDAPDMKQTRAEIRAVAKAAGLSSEWADAQIDSGVDVTAVRAAAFEEIRKRKAPTFNTRVVASSEDPAVTFRRASDALAFRMGGPEAPADSRAFVGLSLQDLARDRLSAAGVSTRGMDVETLFRAAHTTSDFPQLLTSAGSRTLMAAYAAAESALKRISRQRLHTDFRPHTRLKLSGMGTLAKVNEHGEIKSTTRAETTETFKLDTFGSLFSLTRQALVNDDLNAFGDFAQVAGRAAAETEAQLLLTLLTQSSGAGPVMGEDNKRMFHADHGNIAAPAAALDEDGLSAARRAMRAQKGIDGKTLVSVTPKYLLVGPDLETAAEKLLAEIQPTDNADVNVFAGKLALLVEPRLSGRSWYVFADPGQVANLEHAYLSSAQGPQIAARDGWDVLGREFRVTLDFGAGPVDFRGGYRSAGV